jgi:glutamate synthase (NADPH/NADH) small chain
VIKALGFEPEDLPTLWGVPGLEVTRWGTIKADFRTHDGAAGLRGLCVCGRHRARARMTACGLGDPRRARGGAPDHWRCDADPYDCGDMMSALDDPMIWQASR